MIDHHDPESAAAATEAPSCPKCQGQMWDNREGKRNPKAPDFKCKDRNCDGVIWPPRTANAGAAASSGAAAVAAGSAPACPICGGPMWDDRATKRNPRAPDFKCKNKPKVRGGPGCEGVIWPPRDGQQQRSATSGASSSGNRAAASASSAPPSRPSAPPPSFHEPYDFGPPPVDDAPPHDDDDLPF